MRSFRVVPNQAALAQQFDNLRHDARGASFLLPHQQLGALALPTNPSNTQTATLTINGSAVVFTFVSAIGSTAGNVLIGATAAATAANLLALLNQPQTSTTTGIALSAANQALVGYLLWSLVGTTITPSSSNNSLYAPLSSFSAATTATGGSWTAQTMQLYVEPGVVYVNGTRVIFSGGSSPTVTAPSSHPRIDLLTIDNAGTLAWTTGSENVSPTAPAYPADKVVLCELYNVVSETALYDYDNQQASQGYIYNDVRPLLGLQFNPAAIPDSLVPDADGTRDLGSGSFEWNNVYAKTAVYVSGVPITGAKFGGTGTDGALTVTSGNTNIDCANAKVFIKNYTSISITGTGSVTFINPHSTGTFVILRSQGNVTLTSSAAPMLDASGMGAAGGAAKTVTTTITTANGNNGNNGVGAPSFITNFGLGGTNSGSTAGAASVSDLTQIANIPGDYLFQYPFIFPGSGGGSGGVFSATSSGSTSSGAGGNGGAGLIIECNGALNFTTASGISVGGKNGGNGDASGGSGNNYEDAGGGGGAGGSCLILYNQLTSASGTITVSGGTGGKTNSTNFANGTVYGGGGGGSPIAAGSAGVDVGSANTKDGGDGAAGQSWVLQNHAFS